MPTPARNPVASAPETPADRPPLAAGIICPECAYDLRGSVSDRCSECGADLGRLHRGESLIAWERRGEVGWVRAYLATLAAVYWQSERFCRSMCAPVSHTDARLFRLLTVLITFLPIAATILAVTAMNVDGTPLVRNSIWWVVGAALAVLLATLWYVPGVVAFYFHTPRLTVIQQDRAVALSFYAWTPFILLLIPAVFVVTATQQNESWWEMLNVICAGAFVFGVAMVLFWRLETFTRHLVREPFLTRLGRLTWYALQSIALIGVFILIVGGGFYLLVIIESLR